MPKILNSYKKHYTNVKVCEKWATNKRITYGQKLTLRQEITEEELTHFYKVEKTEDMGEEWNITILDDSRMELNPRIRKL